MFPYASQGSWLYQVTGSSVANFGTGPSTQVDDAGYFRVDLVSADAGTGTCAFRVSGFTSAVGTSVPSQFSTRATSKLLEVLRGQDGSWAPTLQDGTAAWTGDFLFTNDVSDDGGSERGKATTPTTVTVLGAPAGARVVSSSFSNVSDQYAEKVYDTRASQTLVEGVGLVDATYDSSFQDKSVTTSWAASTVHSHIALLGYSYVGPGDARRSAGTLDLAGVAASAHPSLTATTQGASAVALAWTDDCLNETSWIIERSGDGGGTFSPIATLPAGTTSHQDSVDTAAAYAYRVKAHNTVGDSGYSNVAASQAYGVPTAPVLTGATWMNVNVAAPGSHANWVTYLTVRWDSVNGATQRLTVQYSTDGGASWVDLDTRDAPASAGEWTTAWEQAGSGYPVRLVAGNPWGSAASNSAVPAYR
jgi:hypothetical protein